MPSLGRKQGGERLHRNKGWGGREQLEVEGWRVGEGGHGFYTVHWAPLQNRFGLGVYVWDLCRIETPCIDLISLLIHEITLNSKFTPCLAWLTATNNLLNISQCQWDLKKKSNKKQCTDLRRCALTKFHTSTHTHTHSEELGVLKG